MEVGSTVRARRYHLGQSTTRRAIVATLQDAEACLLWEDDVPRPLHQKTYHDSQQPFFLVTPHFAQKDSAEETNVPVSDIMELLDFENQQLFNASSDECTAQDSKERGDQLLRIGDASAAVAYYEHALSLTSTLQIGSTVLIKCSGRAVAAEVDCINNDAKDSSAATVDLTIMETGEDKLVPATDIMLCLLESGNNNDRVQERILLNLTRCLLQLAETATASSAAERRVPYLRSAVLATTLALEAATVFYRNNSNYKGETMSNLEVSALLLRSQAQSNLHKFPHAFSDVKKVLAVHPQHKDASSALQRLEYQKVAAAKLDKRLATGISQWVQTALNDSSASSGDTKKPNKIDDYCLNDRLSHNPSSSRTTIPWLTLIAMLLFAWFLQQNLQS